MHSVDLSLIPQRSFWQKVNEFQLSDFISEVPYLVENEDFCWDRSQESSWAEMGYNGNLSFDILFLKTTFLYPKNTKFYSTLKIPNSTVPKRDMNIQVVYFSLFTDFFSFCKFDSRHPKLYAAYHVVPATSPSYLFAVVMFHHFLNILSSFCC